MAAAAGAALGGTSQILGSVVDGLDALGVLNEQQKKDAENVIGMVSGAADLAMGIASGDPMKIIQGSIALIVNGFELFDKKSRDAAKRVKEHEENLKDLQESYKGLEKAIDKALGTGVYDAQAKAIQNQKQQIQELQLAAEAEGDKKKKDQGKIDGYKDQAEALKDQIEATIQGIKESILTSDVKGVANELGSAIIDAFVAGEDAAAAWGDKVNDIVGGIIKKLLIQKLVEGPVGGIINSYMSKWVGEDGQLLMDADGIMNSASEMGDKLTALGGNIESVLATMPESIQKYLGGDGGSKKALSGSIQNVSEETASIISGQMNAMRINQIESIAIMRNQLLALDRIAVYTFNLVEILSVLKSLNNNSLRSQGL